MRLPQVAAPTAPVLGHQQSSFHERPHCYEPAQWLLLKFCPGAWGYPPNDGSSTDFGNETVVCLGLQPGFNLLQPILQLIFFLSLSVRELIRALISRSWNLPCK